MKRAKQLQPLSREHHLGLVLASHAKDCTDNDELIETYWKTLVDYIDNKTTYHFTIEDDLVLLTTKLVAYQDLHPKVKMVLDEVARQHENLQDLMTIPVGQTKKSAKQVIELANSLFDHIRYEERTLFPLVEELLTEEELDEIYAACADSVKRTDDHR